MIVEAEATSAAEDFEEAMLAGIVNLAAIWTPDALGTLLEHAMELAALEGREAVFVEADEDDAGADGAAFADDDMPFARQEFREQIDFLTQKRPVPTNTWTDWMHGQHDRGFVVAGVTDVAMLEECQTAIIDGARTYDIRGFAAEFDRLVDKYGWSYNGGREWRIRTIFETNIRTSYMAGRLKQMRNPDLVRTRPYWQYRHAETRVPLNPRPQHLMWDNMVLLWNDPWWDVYFPPNGWLCSCGCRTLSQRQLERMGKTGPDTAPPIQRKPYTHTASGETVELPEGTAYGWDYMPGDHWERGLVPSALINDPAATAISDARGRHLVQIDTPRPFDDLLAAARPFRSQPMAEGLAPGAYLDALLAPFRAPGDSRGSVLWTDAAGTRLVISGDMFFNARGEWKGHKRGHAVYAPLIAETLLEPDEIWLGVRTVPLPGIADSFDTVLTRRYIRVDPGTGLMVLLEMGRRHWREITGYAALNRQHPDFGHIEAQRVGRLLWWRR